MSHDSPTPEPMPMDSSDRAFDEMPAGGASEDVTQAEAGRTADEFDVAGAEASSATDASAFEPLVDSEIPAPSEPEDESVEIDGMEIEVSQESAPSEAGSEENNADVDTGDGAVGDEHEQAAALEAVIESDATVAADPQEAIAQDEPEGIEPMPDETEPVASAPPEFVAPMEPPAKPRKASAIDTVSNLLKSIVRLVQRGLQAVIPLSRAIAILVLRFVIQILQLLLDLLDGSWQSRSVPPTSTPATVTSSGSTSSGQPQPTSAPVSTSSKKLPVFLRAMQTVWNALITVIRTILPDAWNQKLPTPLLNLLLAAVLALGLWTAPTLLFPRSVPATSKAPPEQPSTTDQQRPPVPEGAEQLDGALPASSSEIELPLDPVISESGELTFERPQGIPANRRKSIAALQERLSNLRDRYDSTPLLIQSVRVNPVRDRLTVELGEDWYTLTSRRQDQLVNDLWARSQQADLNKLLLVDSTQTPLARSPMVGTDVVVLQRQKALLPEATPSDSFENQ